MTTFLAFLHHLAAFALVGALAVEFIVIRDELNVRTARRLAFADLVLGVSAGVLLIVGLLRVFYFEKGAAFYFANGAFLAKLTLFVLVALLSIYPTLKFMRWRRDPNPTEVPAVRRVLHLELIGVVLILYFAASISR